MDERDTEETAGEQREPEQPDGAPAGEAIAHPCYVLAVLGVELAEQVDLVGNLHDRFECLAVLLPGPSGKRELRDLFLLVLELREGRVDGLVLLSPRPEEEVGLLFERAQQAPEPAAAQTGGEEALADITFPVEQLSGHSPWELGAIGTSQQESLMSRRPRRLEASPRSPGF